MDRASAKFWELFLPPVPTGRVNRSSAASGARRLSHTDSYDALLSRPFTKGRDLYDLFWYVSDPEWPAPNLTLLNNAWRHSRQSESPLTEQTWGRAVVEKLSAIDWWTVVRDVQPFLEREHEVQLLTYDNLSRLLRER